MEAFIVEVKYRAPGKRMRGFMLMGAARRLRHWFRLLRRSVWPLIVIPLAILLHLFALRDEFLPPELAAKLKMPAWLPELPWYWWTIALLLIVVIAVLEGSYREHVDALRSLDSIDLRQLEAQEANTAELRRHTEVLARQSNPVARAADEQLAALLFPKPKPKACLQINVGDSGPFFKTKGSLYSTKRTLNIQVENIDPHKSLSKCQVHVTTIAPQTEYEGPWLLHDEFSLNPLGHEFIPLASYGEARNPKTYPCGDTFMVIHVEGVCPALPIDRPYTVALRATALESPACEIKCKLWVNEEGRLAIEKIP